MSAAYKGLLAAIVPMVAALPAAAATNDNLLQAAAPWAAIVLGSLAWSLVAPQPKKSLLQRDAEVPSAILQEEERDVSMVSQQPVTTSPVVYEGSESPVGNALAMVDEQEEDIHHANAKERSAETVLGNASEPSHEMTITASKAEANIESPMGTLLTADLLEQSKVPKMEGSPDRSAAKSHVLAAKDSAINSAIPKPVELETEESSPALAMTETTPTAAAANSPAQSQDSIPSPAVALDEQHTRGNEETSIGGSPVTIMAATDGKEGVSGDKQAAKMQKQYEARVTPLKQTAAQKEAKAQKEAEEQKLWEARRAKAQELYSAAQAKAAERTVKPQTKMVTAVSPVHHLVKFTPKALLTTILEQFAGIWKWMRASMSALFQQKPAPKGRYT